MKDRGLLLESQLQVEQLHRRFSMIESDLNSAIRDREEGKEEKRLLAIKVAAAEASSAEFRSLANAAKEECKRREDRLERIEMELSAKDSKMRELEQQLYYATMDKVFFTVISLPLIF